MLRFFLIAVVVGGSVSQPLAQNNNVLAKIEYEAAEASYAAGQFAQALASLRKAEEFLGSTNARILYLEILAFRDLKIEEYGRPTPRYEGVIADQIKAFDSVAAYCDEYLKAYSSTVSEDKVRDVYASVTDARKITTRGRDVLDKIAVEKTRLQEQYQASVASNSNSDALLRERVKILVNEWAFNEDLLEQSKNFNAKVVACTKVSLMASKLHHFLNISGTPSLRGYQKRLVSDRIITTGSSSIPPIRLKWYRPAISA